MCFLGAPPSEHQSSPRLGAGSLKAHGPLGWVQRLTHWCFHSEHHLLCAVHCAGMEGKQEVIANGYGTVLFGVMNVFLDECLAL